MLRADVWGGLGRGGGELQEATSCSVLHLFAATGRAVILMRAACLLLRKEEVPGHQTAWQSDVPGKRSARAPGELENSTSQ
eukprot:1137652-Alexandrium_andersonii.AAC.1